MPGPFSYDVPEDLPVVRPGMRVVVPFGKGRRLYTGIVTATSPEPSALARPRRVVEVLDEAPVVEATQLGFWRILAEHYLCTLGEVMVAALPGQLVLSSETRVMRGPKEAEQGSLKPRESLLLSAVEERGELSLDQAGELLGVQHPMRQVKELVERGLLALAEEVHETYRPRTEKFVELHDGIHGEEALHAAFDALARAEKQLALLMRFVELSRCLGDDPVAVTKRELLKRSGASPALLRELVKRKVLQVVERPLVPDLPDGERPAPIALTPPQEEALNAVRNGWKDHPAVLLHGVTASGKTELYMRLMEEAMERGEQVLYLLPEIALTTQVIARLKRQFGDRVAVYHSRLAPRERTELWLRMLRDPASTPILVGARSALFLPFQGLGLVIVDEEHDPSYKQHDPAPRYQARDMAIVLAGLHGARTLLGSATPSLESLFNADQGKYGKALLTVRHGDARLPAIERVDVREAARRHRMQGRFSQDLLDAMSRAMDRHEQVILFQNRRGYAPVWQCETCGSVPQCLHCDVSLTYHKRHHKLHCHYCGREYDPPLACGECGGQKLRMVGFGTEKIEEELATLLPEARIARMDQDSTRGKHAFEQLLERFGAGEIDVLVGTQMVTKGLDFDRVTVV
ncbi:MAG: primosomal protein N', partial [Flavobacteriales bacterium]|nr:primosomal protein N' [Flavobacteriales bacterium]